MITKEELTQLEILTQLHVCGLHIAPTSEKEIFNFILYVAISTTIGGGWKVKQLHVNSISSGSISETILRGALITKKKATTLFADFDANKFEV